MSFEFQQLMLALQSFDGVFVKSILLAITKTEGVLLKITHDAYHHADAYVYFSLSHT